MDELNMLTAAKRGSQEAFLALVEPLERQLYQTALGIVRNAHDAEDAWQNTVLNAWRHIRQLRGAHFKTWLTRILLNEAKTILRKRGRTPVPLPILPQEVVSLDRTEAMAVHGYLDSLSEQQREVILLRFWMDLPLNEIATLTGVPLSTAKSRLYQGVAKLKAQMKEDDFCAR